MNDSADQSHLLTSGHTLVMYRRGRAQSRDAVRATLDAMAAESRRYLGAVFTENDPLTNCAVALVVRSDERLPDDYDRQSPRPPTDTVNRLIVEVLGRCLTIEIDDAGSVQASGDAPNLSLQAVKRIRVSGSGPDVATYLVTASDDSNAPAEIPFVRALADLIDTVVLTETRFGVPSTQAALMPNAEATPISV